LLSTGNAETSVTLAWNPSSDASVTGYYVYSREENSATATRTNVGVATQSRIGGLKEGARYAFTVTAYNAAGAESVPSNEAAYVVPVPIRMINPSPATGYKRVRFPAAPGHWYELQASTNLLTWTTIWQTGVANSYSWVEFQDPQSKTLKARFYRLVVH
jgi:chitin-binding protein